MSLGEGGEAGEGSEVRDEESEKEEERRDPNPKLRISEPMFVLRCCLISHSFSLASRTRGVAGRFAHGSHRERPSEQPL